MDLKYFFWRRNLNGLSMKYQLYSYEGKKKIHAFEQNICIHPSHKDERRKEIIMWNISTYLYFNKNYFNKPICH